MTAPRVTLAQNHILVPVSQTVSGTAGQAGVTQSGSLNPASLTGSGTILPAALVQNYNLTVEDLAVAVEMTPVQFLTGLRAGTIRLIDESWVVVETLGEPVRIRRVVATRSLAVDVTGGS